MKYLIVAIVICTIIPLIWGQCGLPPLLTVDHTPRGNVVNTNGMDIYETGRANSTKILLAVHDINGFNPPRNNILQICDHLGEMGYKVIMPDYFHGVIMKEGSETVNDWHEAYQTPTWNSSVREDTRTVLDLYKAQNNASTFGVFGFCFGGKIAAHAVADFADDIKVAAQYHPAGAVIDDAALIRSPSILLPGANDADMTDYCALINTNLGPGSCEYHHFRDVNHGYSGSGADWSNSTIRTRAQEALTLWTRFLCANFPL